MAILRHRSNHSGDAKKPILVIVLVLLASCSAFADLPNTVPAAISLWSNGAPGSEARAAEPEEVAGDNVSNIHNPTLTPYVPEREKASGTAVIICPGGGHSKLCLGHEGYALAEWFRDRGIAAFVLKYRLAREKGSNYTIQDHAMADARRALRLVRSRAVDWHIEPDRIGILGFSAGGELAAYAAMKSDPGRQDATDTIERYSTRTGRATDGTPTLFRDLRKRPRTFRPVLRSTSSLDASVLSSWVFSP